MNFSINMTSKNKEYLCGLSLYLFTLLYGVTLAYLYMGNRDDLIDVLFGNTRLVPFYFFHIIIYLIIVLPIFFIGKNIYQLCKKTQNSLFMLFFILLVFIPLLIDVLLVDFYSLQMSVLGGTIFFFIWGFGLTPSFSVGFLLSLNAFLILMILKLIVMAANFVKS